MLCKLNIDNDNTVILEMENLRTIKFEFSVLILMHKNSLSQDITVNLKAGIGLSLVHQPLLHTCMKGAGHKTRYRPI